MLRAPGQSFKAFALVSAPGAYGVLGAPQDPSWTVQDPSAQTPKPTRQHLKTVSEPTDSPSH